MSQTDWITTLLLLIPLTVHTVKSDSHVIVRPTDSDPSVCGGHATCDTLNNLISNSQTIFSDNAYSVFEFQQGRHEVAMDDGTQLIVNVTGELSWQGNKEGDIVISCESSLVFVFLNITSLTLKNLNFSNCGYELPDIPFVSQYKSHFQQQVSAAIALLNLISFHMQGVVISQSRGYGLLGLNLWGTNSISSSHFLQNNANNAPSDDRTGGNAAFYFYNRTSYKPKKKKAKNLIEVITLTVSYSVFCGGIHWSDRNDEFSCSKLNGTDSILKVNGLAIIAGQQEYRVEVQVSNTNLF